MSAAAFGAARARDARGAALAVGRPRRRRRRGRARGDARGASAASRTRAATATTRSRCSSPGACRTRAAWGRRSRSAPAACARRSRPRRPCRWPLPPTSCSASAARKAPDAVRVIWVSGIVQTETDMGAAGRRRADARALAVNELDRKPSSCPYLYAWNGERFEFVTDFLGARRDGLLRRPGRAERPRPRRVRAHRPRARSCRGTGATSCASRTSSRRCSTSTALRLLAVDHPADVAVYPDEGMTEPPKPFRLFAVRDPRTPRATDHRGRDVTARLARTRPGLRGRPAARARSAATRRSTRSPSTSPALPAVAHGPAPHRLDRLRVLERQRGRAPGRPRVAAARGSRWSRRDGTWRDRGRGGRRSPSAGRRRSSSTSPGKLGALAARPDRHDHARLLGPGRGRRAGAGRGARARGRSTPLRADLARAWLLGRGDADGASRSPSTTRASRGSRPGRRCRAATRARATCGRCSPRPTTVRRLEAGRRGGAELRRLGAAAAARRAGPARSCSHGDGFSKEMDINSASPDVVLPLPYHGMKAYPYAEADAPARGPPGRRAGRGLEHPARRAADRPDRAARRAPPSRSRSAR